MAREFFSNEDKKNLALEIVRIASERPISMVDLLKRLEESTNLNKNMVTYSYVTTCFIPMILESKILGKSRKYGKLFVDDYKTAKEMIEDYFLSREKSAAKKEVNKRDVNTWRNIRAMVQIIESNPGISTGELRERYSKVTGKGMTLALLDRYNEVLTLNNMGIDFYGRGPRGESMQLSNPNSIRIIDKIIESFEAGRPQKDLKEKIKENKRSENELNRLSNQELETVKVNILNILYLDSSSNGMTVAEIESYYTNRYNKRISSNTLQLILRSMVDLGLKYDRITLKYSIDNYPELLKKISPRRLDLDLVVKVRKDKGLPEIYGLGNGTRQDLGVIGDYNLWEITGYNSKELTRSLVLNVAKGDIDIVSPLYIREKINDLIDEYLSKLNELL